MLLNSLGPIADISVTGIYYGGFNTRRYTIVHGFCLFPIGPKGLNLRRLCNSFVNLY